MKTLIGLLSAAVMAAGLSAPLALAAGTQPDRFIRKAIEGNLSEVKVGRLAERKGATAGVRHFGAVLAEDHAKANRQAMSAASSMGVTPPAAPSPKERRIYEHLAALSGKRFDAAFVEAMVKDHRQDIAKYSREAKARNNPASNYAEATLPDLHKHLRLAEALERRPSG
jgi:putative membrane protein